QVLHADGTPDTGEDHAPWTAVADAGGLFESSWHVCEDDCVGSTLLLSASGSVSGRSARVLFTDATAAPTYQRLASFGLPGTGDEAVAGLIQGTDGFYYGTASMGGAFGYGTIFRVNSDGTQFVVLKNLFGRSGTFPQAELVQGTDGALYGTAWTGGL